MERTCRKVEELKTLKQLDLGLNDLHVLEYSGRNIDDIVALVRKIDMRNDYDAIGFADELQSSSCDYFLRNVYSALDGAGFLNKDIRSFAFLVKNYVGRNATWINAWEAEDDFNQNYEDFAVSYDDELVKVLEVLKINLP